MTTLCKKTLAEAAGLILIALVLAGAAFFLRPTLRPMAMGRSPVIAGPRSGSPPENAMPLVSLKEAEALFDKGGALFADARPLKAFQQGHIRGALNLDPNEFDNWSETFFSQFSPDMTIVTYCDGPRCPLSSELAEDLVRLGYEKVFILKNGWSQWQKARLPTEKVAQ